MLAGLALDCAAFGELGAPVHLAVLEDVPDAVPGGGRRLRVEARQGGKRLAVAETVWRNVGGRAQRPLECLAEASLLAAASR